MRRIVHKLFGPALVAGLTMSGAAQAEEGIILSPRVAMLTAGLFCAPEEGGRRPAPDTINGWVHAPGEPIEMVAQGQVVPAMLGLGFGVRFTLADTQDTDIRYTVTHPPMPPSGATSQSWDGQITAGFVGTALFQFDITDELQPGDWQFSATSDGDMLFSVGFTVRSASALPGMLGLCSSGDMLSLNQTFRAAEG